MQNLLEIILIDYQCVNYFSKKFSKKSFEKICKSKKLPYLCIRNEETRFSPESFYWLLVLVLLIMWLVRASACDRPTLFFLWLY